LALGLAALKKMKHNPYFLLAATVTVNTAFPPLAAAEQDHTSDSFFLDDTPVVLSATRLKQSLADAPAAVTVIDKFMIKASGAKEIVELFRLVPGMQVGSKRQHLPSASYHGMSDEFARGMQVLVDGHSIYNASFGGLFWADYPLLIEDIERIEVIRGPAAATYGPNAFLGVINIITTHTSQDQGTQANFRAGGGDAYRGAIRHGGQWNDLGYRISYAHNQNDGLEGTIDGVKTNTLSSRFDYQLSNKDTLQYNLGISEGQYELGTKNKLSDPARQEQDYSITQNFRWEHQFNPIEQVSLHLTHNRHEINDDLISNGKKVNNNYLSEQIDFEFQHILSPFQSTRIVWGLGSRLDRIQMDLWTGDDDKTNILYRIFANIEQKFLEDFTLNLGALLEKNSYNSYDISPKISLNYQWSDQHNFRIMASRASRMPILGEQNLSVATVIPSLIAAPVKTNETLKPVEVITFEAGHHGQFFNNKLATDIKVAHQRFRRLTRMDYNPNTFSIDYSTGDVASSLNYEMQVDYKPNAKSLFHLGYSWINIQHKGGISDYRESAPHNTLNALTAYEFPWQLQASLGYYYRSEMQYIRTSSDISQYQRLDFILRKTFNLSSTQKLELSFIHKNNIGSKDEFNADNRLADRTFIELSYQFD